MADVAERYRNVAGRFTAVTRAVPEEAWDDPAPCEGWVARDVVRHLVEWVPPFLHDGAGVVLTAGPSVDGDPVAAWTTMSDGVQALLDDPAGAQRAFDHPRAGRHTLEDAIGMFLLGDVLVHTWDLARSAGLEVKLDPDEVRSMLDGLEPMDEVLRASGEFGPRVLVPEDADEQTRLLAFTGRRP